jgi:hypothetical protein
LAIKIPPYLRRLVIVKPIFAVKQAAKRGDSHPDKAHLPSDRGMKAAGLDVSTINSRDDFAG